MDFYHILCIVFCSVIFLCFATILVVTFFIPTEEQKVKGRKQKK